MENISNKMKMDDIKKKTKEWVITKLALPSGL
jgi:hypothetical protein